MVFLFHLRLMKGNKAQLQQIYLQSKKTLRHDMRVKRKNLIAGHLSTHWGMDFWREPRGIWHQDVSSRSFKSCNLWVTALWFWRCSALVVWPLSMSLRSGPRERTLPTCGLQAPTIYHIPDVDMHHCCEIINNIHVICEWSWCLNWCATSQIKIRSYFMQCHILNVLEWSVPRNTSTSLNFGKATFCFWCKDFKKEVWNTSCSASCSSHRKRLTRTLRTLFFGSPWVIYVIKNLCEESLQFVCQMNISPMISLESPASYTVSVLLEFVKPLLRI